MDLAKLWLTGVAVFIVFMSGSGIATPQHATTPPAITTPDR